MDVQCICDRLIEIAHAGTTISIDELAGAYCPDLPYPKNRAAINRVLSEITFREYASGRPLLPVVVILPEIGYPAMGFFLLARELGLNLYDDERSFYDHELKRVHQHWRMQIPVSRTVPYMKVGANEVRVPA